MKIVSKMLKMETKREFEFINITDKIKDFVKKSEIKNGSILVFSKHTTLAVKINEFEPLLLKDIFGLTKRIAPTMIDYWHDKTELRKDTPIDEPRNARGHISNMVFETSQIIPVMDGKLILGKWQQVFAIETSGPRKREIIIQIIGKR